MRIFKKALDLRCPKCETVNDVGSNRRIEYSPSQTILGAGGQIVKILPEIVTVYCGVCTYRIEEFAPADTVKA